MADDKVLQADELINGPGDPVAMSLFKTATKQATTEYIPESSLKHYTFNPHAPEFEYIPNATPATTNIDYFNALRQSNWTKAGRAFKQFGANVLSSVGQGLANTFDFVSLGNTIKGEITGSDDNFTSSLFGISTKEMQEWANGVAERNKVFESNPGDFNLGDFGWWSNQFAQAGTGVGMAIEALGTTVAIEALSGGTGTASALGKLKNLFSGANKAGVLKEGLDIAKGLRSAATLYGTISRYSESRMEASMNYENIYNQLSQEKDEQGKPKFNEDEKHYLASQGARRTFNLNMLLLPLDIMAYRTMVFNPVSGSAKGLIERGLTGITNKYLRGAAKFGIVGALEGTEEGFQYVAEQEGDHYAKVLSGSDDGSTFLQRFASDVQEDQFWNNFAGGVIGSPIIAGTMHLANKAMQGNRSARLNSVHEDYVRNIAKMDNAIGNRIRGLEAEGKIKEASVLRRQFGANKALSALHLDALTDRTSGFDSYLTFLEGTLGEINENKLDSLKDLGFNNPTQEQVQQIKDEFSQYIDDAKTMQSIYSNVSQRYNKNFAPEIARDHFQLNRMLKLKGEIDTQYNLDQSGLAQYGELSSFGKDIYNAEYVLKALQQEQKRLTELYRNTEDAQEKENVNRVLEDTKEKMQETIRRFNELQHDAAYTPAEKKKDNDIIRSALRSNSYMQTIYDRAHLENQISLKRKDIGLWDDPQYTANKNKQAISKAKTQQQVEATEESITANNQVTPETAQAVQDKKDEIAANEAAQIVQEQQQSAQQSADVPGNGNLFEEDNGLIEGIKEQVNGSAINVNDPENPNPQVGEQQETYLFSPAKYDFEKSSEDARNRVIAGVRGLIDRLGIAPTFEDLVRHVIRVQGETVADDIFNALKYGWEKSGMKVEDYQAIYNKVFGNPMEDLIAGVSQLRIETEQQLEVVSEVTTKEIAAKETNKPEFDNNNQPVYTYKGIVTNESSPKLAFVTRLSEIVQTTNEDGTIGISHEYTEQELNAGDYVDSLQLLDPDKFDEGTEMVIRIPSNFNEIKIPIYNTDGTKGQTMTFGQYVAQNNIAVGSQEYLDKLPMIIYRKGAPATEKGLAFVHDVGWYHPLRFNQEKRDDMAKAISNTREIRASVFATPNDSTSIIITGKRQTTFSGLKTKKGETVSLRQANPETQLTVALTTDSLSTSSRNTVFPNNNSVLVNNSPFSVGQVLDVRRYGKKDGKKSYIALPVLRPKLDDISKSSVLQAIYIYANRTNQTPAIRSKHNPIVKQINDTMGLDILSPQGLEKYLQHFITTFNTEKAKTNEDVEAQAKAKFKAGTPYIAFIAGGNIVFGRANEAAFTSRDGAKKFSFFINPNTVPTTNVAFENLAKDRFIGWYEQNVDLDNLNRNKPIVTIDRSLTASVSSTSYNDYLLDRLQTNIRSFNIGTAEKPNYVTNIQPVITYELASNLQQEQSKNEEVINRVKQEQAKSIQDRIAEVKSKLGHQANQQKFMELLDRLNEARKGLSADKLETLLKNLYNEAVAIVGGTTDPKRNTEARGDMDSTWIENPNGIKGADLQQYESVLSTLFNYIQPDARSTQQPIVAEKIGTSNINNESFPIYIGDIVLTVLQGQYANEQQQIQPDASISEIERQIIEQAKRDLGNDFGIANDIARFSPSTDKFGVGNSLYSTSIDKVVYAIGQGVSLDEAIRRGVEYIKSNYGDNLVEEDYVKHLKEAGVSLINTKKGFIDKLNEINEIYNTKYKDSKRYRFVDFKGVIQYSNISEEDILAGIKESSLDSRDKNKVREDISARAKGITEKIKNLKDTAFFSPSVLTGEQRQDITLSINRIAGLTPDQQFDIVDFMYNQITAMVNLDNTVVSRSEVDKQVEKAFNEIIAPLKAEYEAKVKELNELISKHSALQSSGVPNVIKDYEYRISKINAIEQNFEVLKDEAYNRVAKYTGITEDKTVTEQENDESATEENPDETVEDKTNEKERDFWTDVLTENPESKLSYSMRRFFGQIREYDKSGKPMTGFLGLPTYTGADTVIRTLMVTLADVPSSFDAMIAKLETRVDAVPWMKEVIEKLKGTTQQRKNQFVTVMSNTSLRMKFTMISFNRRAGTWTTKVYDTNLNGIASAVKDDWRNNFYDSNLVIVDSEGNYQLNKAKAESLISRFEAWKGENLKDVPTELLPTIRPIVDQVKNNKPATLQPSGDLQQWLKDNLAGTNAKVRFSMKGFQYQVKTLGDNKYEISFLEQTTATKVELDSWLKEFGIILSPETLDELMTKGLFHNYRQVTPNGLFDGESNTNGLMGILYNKLKILVNKESHDFTEYGDSPLDESVITSLANLESKYNNTNTPFGFRDNGKSFFALTAPKFITDRNRDLKLKDSIVRKQLESLSFSQNSVWLKLLNDDKFREKFGVAHIGANAFKELGRKLYRDNGINKLSDADHELTKLGMFWDMTQGEVSYTTPDGKMFSEYPDTSVGMRMATMFSPTMSDKHLMTLITTAVLNLQNKDLTNGQAISDEVAKIIYEQTVKPELMRMIKFHQNGGITNISAYDRGASMFLFMPEMNNIEYTPGLKLISAIKHKPFDFTLQFIEGNQDLMNAFLERIKKYVNDLTAQKITVWEKNGYITYAQDGSDISYKFFDKRYLDKFRGDNIEKVQMAAMDYIVNSLVSNANAYMTMAGDPAMYFKSKASDYLTIAKDTFVNAGKRLANQIAPGTTLSNSENEKYIQVFLNDRKSLPEIPYLKFVTKINDGNEITDREIEILQGDNKSAIASIAAKYPVSAGYFGIEGSDAQEYTTWKEHLDILSKLGKTPDTIMDVTPEEIREARELFSSDVTRAKLTEKQMQLIAKVMQPIKPVYTGQIYDAEQDVMRTVYIKSSSFPLIPQLTAGMEIDKLRLALEKLEASTKMPVRASYQSANKVGSVTSPIEIWKTDGTIDQEELNELTKNDWLDRGNGSMYEDTPLLILDRKNFRIQQEVPFKSGKTGEDRITLGTQLMKLLFGDEIMNYNGFMYKGKEYSGKELHRLYNDTFIKLIEEKRNQLYNELGLDNQGIPVDLTKSMERLQSILKDEAVKRGYPLQDIQGLTLNKDGQFNLPLWASSNSNRYESMLNSIVTNRIIRMKFPGNSFVVGSEEGFRTQDNLEGIDKSKIIWTSSWNNKALQGAYYDNGELKSAQVLVASKFKDSNGNLIDLFTKENGEYKYISQTDQGYRLKENMFSKELLKMLSFRIPTSGHQSASQIEIVGFLPAEAADLMIVPRNFTKQKGLDFDVDKENSYQLWTFMNEDGSLEVLQEKHRDKLLLKADSQMRKLLSGNQAENKLIAAIFGDEIRYTPEDIKDNKVLTQLNSKITEKLMQNDLILMNHSVMGANNPKVQAKINKTLNTDYAESQADFIDQLITEGSQDTYWTPLSDEYQKQKMIAGASGKIGTGAYSLDVVFHSLVQQAGITGRGLQLVEVVEVGDKKELRNKEWRFGNVVSDGKLGHINTLDGGRSISELMSERQNIAVDNEKLQVMGRVNLNDITMDVDKVMNLLGFDKGSDGNSISLLFLSQPIIREFVEAMKNANSNISEFDPDREGTVVSNLIKKYQEGTQELDMGDEYEYNKIISDMMTNENFITNIRADKPDGQFQIGVLNRFLEMKAYGIAIRGIQTTINTDSKGLGKSFFDVIEKRNALNRVGMDTNMILGASNLIGDYISKEEMTNDEISELKNQGYTDIGKYMVKPTTLSGGFNVHGISTAYNLWSSFFPYDAAITNKAFSEILSIIGSDNMADTRTIEMKQDIFRSMKRYFAASKYNGIISATDNINDERKRLYIDSDDNTSLAKYLKTLKQMQGNPVVDTFIKTNKLINRFEFDIQKNGQPSLIKFNNAAGEEFDEQYLYESLATLMEVRGTNGKIELPTVGNKSYTLDSLAQDIIAYAYLGNAIQEAIQFTKYVPVSYLNTVGFSDKMRIAGLWLQDNPNVLGVKIGDNEKKAHLVSEFTMQFVQHNPERVKYKFDQKSFKANTISVGEDSFKLKSEDNPIFISVYDPAIPKGEKKFRLYWFDGDKYTRVPVLGTFGMDEYQPRNTIGTSIVNDKHKLKVEPQAVVNPNNTTVVQVTNPYEIQSKDLTTILGSIIKESNQNRFSPLAEYLLPFAGNIGVKLQDEYMFNGATYNTYNGIYDQPTNTIIIHSRVLNDPLLVADTILHEFVHALTVAQLSKYVDLQTNAIKEEAPSYVTNLVRLYNDLKSKMSSDRVKVVADKVRDDLPITDYELTTLYPFTNIYEFITMALTNKSFQKTLAGIPYKESGMSMLEKFKQIITRVLTAMGVNFKSDTAAAQAINSIFELIERENQRSANLPGQTYYDDSINSDNFGDLEASFYPAAETTDRVNDYIKSLSELEKRC